jgi:cytochrome b6-f complex iron-sulfur subunit
VSTNESGTQRIGRRNFLSWLLSLSFLATLGGVLTPVIAYLLPPGRGAGAAGERVFAGTVTDLPTGEAKTVSVANKPVLVMHTSEGVKAVDATCTHLGCICFWDEKQQIIACPCHAAYFTPNGDVISGPPPAPLPTLSVQVEGDEIYVGGV